ncbi:hypothetical protein GALMADRAFT_1230707 [Galerina marginata CBS 339.88]|uniref:Uncharacterized protein n=1 Tax=Galerina marginata (strain CBS 339.88) TaxID=685588 RepID=A0A067TA62_GALM3|nr:hypothetical protein GALMADRAFT_1230707 [Galerina marginata CBS 339.88]
MGGKNAGMKFRHCTRFPCLFLSFHVQLNSMPFTSLFVFVLFPHACPFTCSPSFYQCRRCKPRRGELSRPHVVETTFSKPLKSQPPYRPKKKVLLDGVA